MAENKSHPITKSARTIFPDPIGPSVTGYNQHDAIVIVLPVKKGKHYKDIAAWSLNGTSPGDLRRLRNSFDEEYPAGPNYDAEREEFANHIPEAQ